MKNVMTVCGPIAPDALGFTSMHEHVLTNCDFYMEDFVPMLGDPPAQVFPAPPQAPIELKDLAYMNHGYFVRHPDVWDLTDETLMAAEVSDFHACGGRAILECSAPGIRGDVEGLKRISEATGVHIIASTGLYAEKSWPERFQAMSMHQFTDYLLDEINNGMEGTRVKPGQIKVASNGNTQRQLDFLSAASHASKETGIMVTAHLGVGTGQEDSRVVYQTLLENGMSPDRLLMCHIQSHVQITSLEALLDNPCAWAPQLDYIREVLDQGVNVCFDCFGMTWDTEAIGSVKDSDTYKIAAIYQLLREGYSDQIVVGTDVFVKNMTRRYGGHGYVRLQNYVVPTLQRIGVEDGLIAKLVEKTPARLLAF
ncbi:phosphotriesterase [Pseudomaricurvus alkylphenolicus]|uniref:phosphotriesterase family protein n=1 Tax=Pseudomaricurvus alkylphenolicus TaxID=1306991 RepID=UPI0014225F30|nr:phosphotriesterase [Pseudomaricurvus alkylphenolicus]NIB43490.1 phosphotriesterase [Pseudomaricurvus alkylphenolicus]